MASLFSHYDKQLQDILSFKAYYMYCHLTNAMVDQGTCRFNVNQSELMKIAHVYTVDFLNRAVGELVEKGLLDCVASPFKDGRVIYTMRMPFYHNNQLCA